MKQEANYKNHHDAQERKNQWIWKPPLTPVGESQAKPDKTLFLRYRGLLW
jgi:hypothetical protein